MQEVDSVDGQISIFLFDWCRDMIQIKFVWFYESKNDENWLWIMSN